MGLCSMPSAADAFFPYALVSHAMLPLVLLKDGVKWVITGSHRHYNQADDDEDDGVFMEESFEYQEGEGEGEGEGEEEEEGEGAERVRGGGGGVMLTRFQSLCNKGAADCGCSCCVCLQGFHREEQVSQVVSCNHFFHSECLNRWMDRSHARATCPLCRSQL